jgi:2-C-methyl-D-erythritol 4-phosphate cytidylyltransferase
MSPAREASGVWVVVPAAGQGARFGGELPKQYVPILGRPLIRHTLERLGSHPRVIGMMVALAADDPHWSGWRELRGTPVQTCVGGRARAESVLAGLRALPAAVREKDWVLVHDAARPCLRHDDLDRLLDHGTAHDVGAILAAPVRDSLKRANADGCIAASEPRERLWRAFTPQLFRRASLERALQSALARTWRWRSSCWRDAKAEPPRSRLAWRARCTNGSREACESVSATTSTLSAPAIT